MPQSVRDQIVMAIHIEQDQGKRQMLMILLGIVDEVKAVHGCVSDLVGSVTTLTHDFHSHDEGETAWRSATFGPMPPKDHVEDHVFVVGERNRRKEDHEHVAAAKKGFFSKAGELAAVALASGLASIGSVIAALMYLKVG